MFEKIGEIFDNRLEIYDEQQLTAIESAREFYPFTAAQLPAFAGAAVLNLGIAAGKSRKFTKLFRHSRQQEQKACFMLPFLPA